MEKEVLKRKHGCNRFELPGHERAMKPLPTVSVAEAERLRYRDCFRMRKGKSSSVRYVQQCVCVLCVRAGSEPPARFPRLRVHALAGRLTRRRPRI